MSMDIGGVDLRLTEVPRGAYDPRLILAEIAEAWPDSVFEGLEDESPRPVSELLDGDDKLNGEEFFVYRNKRSAGDWDRKGATAGNANDMVHIVTSNSRRGRNVGITMVIGDITPEMGKLYWAIDSVLAEAKERFSGSGRSRKKLDMEAELQAAGSTLSAKSFSDLAFAILADLHPEWTVDELACHPHDALQFCEAVRTKAGSPIPDHLIMRVLLNRRKRALPQHP